MNYISIKNWAADDRPREKLLAKGARQLSDTELLAILIGSGTRELSAVELARQILAAFEGNLALLGKASATDLMKIKGIGEAKAISVVAALELGKRKNEADIPERNTINSSHDVFHVLHPQLIDLSHEEFWVLYLNRANRIIEKNKVSQGGISGTVADIRLILKRGIELLASSLIICHNHPSGNLKPSETDLQLTEKIKNAAAQMDIKLLDHLIVTDNSYFSFTDEGIL